MKKNLDEFKDQIRNLVAESRLEEAIQILSRLLQNSPLLDDVVMKSYELTEIKKQIRNGVVTYENARVTKNMITLGILSLASEIEESVMGDSELQEEFDSFLQSHVKLIQEEERLTLEERRRRRKHFDKWVSYMDSLSPKELFRQQERDSLNYLRKFGLTVSDLKTKLSRLGYFDDPIDDMFTPSLVTSLSRFQEDNEMRHIDGMFGELTFQRIGEKLKDLDESGRE